MMKIKLQLFEEEQNVQMQDTYLLIKNQYLQCYLKLPFVWSFATYLETSNEKMAAHGMYVLAVNASVVQLSDILHYVFFL